MIRRANRRFDDPKSDDSVYDFIFAFIITFFLIIFYIFLEVSDWWKMKTEKRKKTET